MQSKNHIGFQNKTSSVVIKSGMWFTICNIITKGIGFITTPIFARLLSKSEFGDYNNFSTWMGILLYITSLNLEASFIRARFDFKEDLDSYTSSLLCLSLLSTIIWFGVVILFISPIEKLMLLNRTDIYAMFLYLLFYPPIQLYQTKKRFEYKYKSTVLITLLIVIGTSLLSVILVLLLSNKLQGRIMGTVIPIILIGFAISIFLFLKSSSIKTSYWKYALPFTLPFIPHLLSMYLLGSMDKVMIKQICGSEDLAMYSLAYTVGTIVTLLVNSMNNAFSPWLGEQLNKGNFKKTRKVSIPYVAFFTFFSVMVVLITPEILWVLGGETYMAARFVIPQVFAGCLMQFIYCMYVNVEQYNKRTVGMAIASILAALFNYITNYIFIRKYGYIAASYTTFFSYLLLMLLHVFLVKKIEKQNVYENRIILSIGGIGALALIGVNLLFDISILRYTVFALFAITALFFAYKYKSLITHYILRR